MTSSNDKRMYYLRHIETNSEIVTCNSDHCIRVTEENIGLQYQAGAAIPVSNGIIQEHFGYIMPVTRPVIKRI
jgi:hypothetical protein